MAHSSVHSPVLVLYVNAVRGDDTFPGTSAQPFRTIGYAVQQAIAGTIIYVVPGRYSTESGEQFPLVIPTDVTLMGDTATSPRLTDTPATILIEGGGSFFSPTAGYQSVTLVLSHRSVIQDVTITNPTEQGTGVWVESARVTLRHCQVNQCQREGMVVTTAGSPLVQDCQFKANRLSGLIFLADGAGTVERTVIQSAIQSAIQPVVQSVAQAVAQVAVQRTDAPLTGYGIAIRDQAAPTLIHNQVTGHQVGIAIAGTATPRLTGNHVSHNRDGIVVMESARPQLGTVPQPGHNAIAANQRSGIQVQTAHTVAIVGNYLSTNPIQGNGVVHNPLATAPEQPAQVTPLIAFPDCIGHWARAFIEALHQQGVIRGFPNGSFYPNESLTRAQYAALLVQLFDLPQVTEAPPFRDVQDSFWAATAIRRVSEMGFIAGFPDGTVRPERELTRVQAIVSLVNGLGLAGGDASELGRYGDRTSIPAYAKDEVATATYKHLVVNHPDTGTLNPNRPITRAEMAVLLYQVQVITGQVGAIASPYIVIPPPISTTFQDVRDTGQLADIPSPHWAAGFIEGLAARQLIQGITPDKFAPERAMSRAEFAALLVQLFNPLPRTAPQAFIDVPSRHWAASAIQRATQAGLISGFADGSFQPQLDIKRWQLFTAVVRALALPERNPSPLDSYYVDMESVPAEARGAIATATYHHLVVNYPNLHRINGNFGATRAEVAATLYQSLVRIHRLPTLISAYLVPPHFERSAEKAEGGGRRAEGGGRRAEGGRQQAADEAKSKTQNSKLHHPSPPSVQGDATGIADYSPTPPLFPPTAILSPVTPIHPIADVEQYLFGYSNQAHLIAQTVTAQLQQQGISAVTYHPQMQVIPLKYDVPADSDILVRLQVLDQPMVVTDPDVPQAATPTIDEMAWQVALSYDPASALSQSLAQRLHRRILDEVGLGDRGLQSVTNLWPDVDVSPSELPAPGLAVLVSLSPMQIPVDDYPPIPISGLVRVLVSEMVSDGGEWEGE